MAIQTCDVLCKLTDQSGEPIDGARITARLMSASTGGGFLQLPDVEYSVTNGRGECTLVLVPNNLNGTQSTYTFEITFPGSRPRYFKKIVVPADRVAVTLDELLDPNGVTWPLLFDGGQVLIDGFSLEFTATASGPMRFSEGPLLFDGYSIELSG